MDNVNEAPQVDKLENQAEQAAPVLVQPKGVRIKFDIHPDNLALLNQYTQLAHKLGVISQPTVDDYMIFCLNAGERYLKELTGFGQ